MVFTRGVVVTRGVVATRGVVFTRGIKKDRNIPYNWSGHILRRNCLLNHVIEGKIEGKNRSNEKERKKM